MNEIEVSRRGKELDFFQGREDSLEINFLILLALMHCTLAESTITEEIS